jgi:transposase-like protein
MRPSRIIEGRTCPKCGSNRNQVNAGKTATGSQRCYCNSCKLFYTINPKPRIYSEEVRQLAIRAYYSGVSARGVGKMFGMSKGNVLKWIKKTGEIVDKSKDEL